MQLRIISSVSRQCHLFIGRYLSLKPFINCRRDMSKCIDCGSELDGCERYCQVCGSPTLVKSPTEKELRDRSTHDPDGFNPQRRTKVILITVLILVMALIVYFISMMVGRLGSMGSSFY
jgi:hypothetical protein